MFSLAVGVVLVPCQYMSRVEASPLLLCFCAVVSLVRFPVCFLGGGLGSILCWRWVGLCVLGFLAAVVQLDGFEAGTVLSLIPLWGGRRRSHAVSSRLSVSPVVGDGRV
jgi:hypothetical protein